MVLPRCVSFISYFRLSVNSLLSSVWRKVINFKWESSFVFEYESQFNLKSSFCILWFCGYVRIISFFSYHDPITLYSMALCHVQSSISLLKTSDHHLDSRFLNICLISSTVLLKEPPNHRIQKIDWIGFKTYTRINSHIWNWSPFSRVAITWRRKGIERQPEVRNNGHAPRDHHDWLEEPQVLVNSERRAIYVRSRTGKIP